MAEELFDDELFAEEPPQPERPPPRRGRQRERRRAAISGETVRRVLVALPWIAFAIAITAIGGWPFTLAMVAIGLVCLRELFVMAGPLRPVQMAAYITVSAIVVTAHLGTAFNVLLVGSACFPLLFLFGARPGHREGVVEAMGLTVLGAVWIGLPLVHAVFLRDLPDHGAALLIDVLIGTFAGDTSAYATGRMFGSHRITPTLSPHKTLEGLIGGFLIGTMAFWFAGLYQDWLSGVDALIMGAAVSAIAPIGDLFASMVKRDLGKKDTGRLFGPHGGLLDRLDAVLFTIVMGYYLALQLVY
jgi:phosphatidate cytidylyltransferase